jgi:hypothetical protein
MTVHSENRIFVIWFATKYTGVLSCNFTFALVKFISASACSFAESRPRWRSVAAMGVQ